MSTDNAAIVQRFIDEVINHGRYEVCDEIVAEDFLELDPLPGQREGREGLKEPGRRTRLPQLANQQRNPAKPNQIRPRPRAVAKSSRSPSR